tara:strand:- start:1880 stop:2845 length:966 start_codon:yes stop_codon:yes gene_type:complete
MEAAEKLKISAKNLNSMLSTSLKKISDTRKRTRKLKAVSILRKRRKKKEAKLEVPSVFKKSVSKIKNKITLGGIDIFGNILGFVSLLLLGVVVNNIDMLKEKLVKAKDKLQKDLKPITDIAKVLYDGATKFIGLFGKQEERDAEYQKLLDDTSTLENESKGFSDLQKKYEDLESLYKKVESGQYGKEKGLGIKESGTLSTGETFKFKDDDQGIVMVTGTDGNVTKMRITDFLSQYKETDLNNIMKDFNKKIKKEEKTESFSMFDLDTFDMSSFTSMPNINFVPMDNDKNQFLYDFDKYESIFSDVDTIVYFQRVRVDKEVP